MLLLTLKIMPVSPSVKLDLLEGRLREVVLKFDSKVHKVEKEPVAFGLNALVFIVIWPDNRGSDELEKALLRVEEVGSVQVVDVRRGLG